MLSYLFGGGFIPHGICFQWQPALLWLHAVSDITIGLAYYAIPIGLAALVLKRKDIAFGWMFWLFALFIVACGTTHFVDVVVLWRPDYGIQGLLKAFTAMASVLTAALLWLIMPQLIAIPTPAQFRAIHRQLSEETVRHERTVEQLHKSEQNFQLLVESVRDCAMFIVDPTGQVSSWNAGAQFIKHYRAEEIIGQHFSCFYTAEDRAAGKPMRALKTAETFGSFQEEGWRVRKDGSLFMADVIINPILGRGGELVGFAKITRDITQRKQAEAELEQAREALAQSQKMEAVGQLTGGIAHDFNNMLTAILGSLELVEGRQIKLPGGAQEMLQVIRHAAERGAELIRRLMVFSRKQTLAPALTDINKLVTGMSELLRRSLGESVAIETVLADGLFPAFVDSNQVESALLNLAVNARDAMPHGGRLTIETGKTLFGAEEARKQNGLAPGQYLFVAVTDSGTGMTQDTLDHAFEPFYTTKAADRGTGLGLSQVYGFVKQSGGYTELKSTVGRGTTVTIYFPRPDATMVPEPSEVAPVLQAMPQGSETILIVEDDDDVRSFSVGAARHLGYNVLEASNAANALAILDARPDVRLLFTDVGLPGMNGRELADAAMADGRDIKVVYTSGYAHTAMVNRGLSERGVLLLPKPFRIQSLAQLLRSALDTDAANS